MCARAISRKSSPKLNVSCFFSLALSLCLYLDDSQVCVRFGIFNGTSSNNKLFYQLYAQRRILENWIVRLLNVVIIIIVVVGIFGNTVSLSLSPYLLDNLFSVNTLDFSQYSLLFGIKTLRKKYNKEQFFVDFIHPSLCMNV